MQGFRSAFVITGFVVLAMGSSLAWKYPRPQPLWGNAHSINQVMAKAQTLETLGIRCHPNQDWSDLLVDASERAKAHETFKGDEPAEAAPDLRPWQTPPALLADLARLPGVKEAQVVVHEGREAVVMLSMTHGAYAGERALLLQVEELVRATCPKVQAKNIKILDQRGSDLNYVAPSFAGARSCPLQIELQAQLDSMLGPRQGLVFVHQGRAADTRDHLQVGLYLVAMEESKSKAVLESLQKSLVDNLEMQNKARETRNRYNYRPILLDPVQVQEWTLSQRTADPLEVSVLRWGLTSEPPTVAQLALGLTALAPAVFAWCLLLPTLTGKHRLRRED